MIVKREDVFHLLGVTSVLRLRIGTAVSNQLLPADLWSAFQRPDGPGVLGISGKGSRGMGGVISDIDGKALGMSVRPAASGCCVINIASPGWFGFRDRDLANILLALSTSPLSFR